MNHPASVNILWQSPSVLPSLAENDVHIWCALLNQPPNRVRQLAHTLSPDEAAEMLVSIAGRIAMAYAAETRGVYRPEWTIEQVAESMERIRSTEDQVIFPVVPTGQIDHIRYSFGMATEK